MIIGHQKQWKYLKRIAELDKIPHALLFSGPEKVGKKTAALEWAKILINQEFKSGQHPDLILVEPEGKEIKIAQIRDLIWKLSLKPYSAPLKVAIMDKSHLMNNVAQNCFLKTLEEPKDKTILILITEYPETLLSTIVSRCERVKFYPVSKREIEDYLREKGVDSEKNKEISKISLGRPGAAKDFLDNQKFKNYQGNINKLIKILKGDLVYRFEQARDLSQENNLREVLNIWQVFLRNTDIQKNTNILKRIQNISFLIQNTNISQRLALETLMLEL